MQRSRIKIGDQGEQLATSYLRKLGYEIMSNKWRCPQGEIDIIGRDGAELVFVEVRTRQGQALPEESVNYHKQQKLRELAYTYTSQYDTSAETAWRIDVIAINIDRYGKLMRLEHIRNAIGAD